MAYSFHQPASSVPQKDGFGLKLGSYPRFQPGILPSREVRGIDCLVGEMGLHTYFRARLRSSSQGVRSNKARDDSEVDIFHRNTPSSTSGAETLFS